MEWIERWNGAMKYIEEHLAGEIDYEEAAKAACCSVYHFSWMVGYMADVSLGEYIRRRRMSLAAVDLRNREEKIIDVALKYGYSSPTAFNRAFQTIHGIPPSMAKENGVALKSYPPVSFKITVKGADEMNYRIEQKEAFRVVGVSQPMYKEIEKNFASIPRMWNQAAEDGTIPRLVGLMNTSLKGVLGISACCTEDNWRYYIGVPSTAPVPEGMEEYTVEAFTWAVFPGTGDMPQSIQRLEQRIATEWLPTSGYEYANGPDIEFYISPDPQNASYEVWVPVVKKD